MDFDLPEILGMSSYAGEAVGPQVPLAQMANQNTPVQLQQLQLPQGPGLNEKIGQIGMLIGAAAAPFAKPQMRQAIQNLIPIQQKLLEQRRAQKSADEVQSLTGLVSTALGSGDPKQLESVVKQMSGLKGLEPETVERLQKLQISLGEKIGQDVQEAQLAEALATAHPENQEVVGKLMKAAPGLKLSGAVQLLKSGLLGEPSKLMPVARLGVVRIPGTGLFAGQGQAAEPQLIIGVPGGNEKSFNLNDLAYTAETGQPAATTANMSKEQAQGVLNRLKEQRQILVPEAFNQRVDIAGAAGGAAAMARARVEAQEKLNEIQKSRAISDSLLGLADQIITAETPTQAGLQAGKLYLESLTKRGGVAAAYADQKGQFAGQLSRSFGGERGVLTEGDIKRTTNGFPAFGDTVAIKEYKKGIINLIVDSAIEAQEALIDGRQYDYRKFHSRIKELTEKLSKAGTSSLPPPPPGFRLVPGRSDIAINPETGELRRLK